MTMLWSVAPVFVTTSMISPVRAVTSFGSYLNSLPFISIRWGFAGAAAAGTPWPPMAKASRHTKKIEVLRPMWLPPVTKMPYSPPPYPPGGGGYGWGDFSDERVDQRSAITGKWFDL